MDIKDEDLEQLYADSFLGVEVGTILTGKILSVKPDGVIVDVGYKSEGMIRGSEFAPDELKSLNVGDDIDVFVVSLMDAEGLLILSKDRANRIRSWDVLEEKMKDETPVEGKVLEKTKGGVFVDVEGIKAFMPGSHIDIRPVKDLDSLVGKKYKMRIIKMNPKRSNIIVSRRIHLEQERGQMKVETLEKLREGAIMPGTVKNITDYGVFVDLGGIDGLLHISDISWGRISHPSKYFKMGDEIEVIVLSYDPETEKVTLGYKQKMDDPWNTVDVKYPVGRRVDGKVVSITDYGAFVEVEDALEGLVHASEIEWAPRPKHPSKYINVGDHVEAVVIKVDKDERRLSLSLKQLKPSPWEVVSERYKEGQVIQGKVRGITEFGAFIGLPEGVDGLVHISDISWTKHIRHPSDVLKKGQEVEAVVLSVDPSKERMALGMKQLTTDPWINDIPQKFSLGDEFDCKVLRKTEFGIFVELDGEVEGLVYSSEMPADADKINEGDIITARIIKVDLANKKIGLSMVGSAAPAEGAEGAAPADDTADQEDAPQDSEDQE